MIDFGFTVARVPEWRLDEKDKGLELWRVELPHQCDSWLITPSDDPDCYTGVDHATAVEQMRAFVAQAQEALACIERRETMGEQP